MPPQETNLPSVVVFRVAPTLAPPAALGDGRVGAGDAQVGGGRRQGGEGDGEQHAEEAGEESRVGDEGNEQVEGEQAEDVALGEPPAAGEGLDGAEASIDDQGEGE